MNVSLSKPVYALPWLQPNGHEVHPVTYQCASEATTHSDRTLQHRALLLIYLCWLATLSPPLHDPRRAAQDLGPRHHPTSMHLQEAMALALYAATLVTMGYCGYR
jgi:hypothetical protein